MYPSGPSSVPAKPASAIWASTLCQGGLSSSLGSSTPQLVGALASRRSIGRGYERRPRAGRAKSVPWGLGAADGLVGMARVQAAVDAQRSATRPEAQARELADRVGPGHADLDDRAGPEAASQLAQGDRLALRRRAAVAVGTAAAPAADPDPGAARSGDREQLEAGAGGGGSADEADKGSGAEPFGRPQINHDVRPRDRRRPVAIEHPQGDRIRPCLGPGVVGDLTGAVVETPIAVEVPLLGGNRPVRIDGGRGERDGLPGHGTCGSQREGGGGWAVGDEDGLL